MNLIITLFCMVLALPSFGASSPAAAARGYNADVDTGTTPEDVWTGGGVITIPTAAATTTILSSSANDAAAGTGARTVLITGLNSSNALITETATMNGTNAVTLTNSFMKILNAEVVTAGSGGVNAGTIDIKHGATVIDSIAIGANKTQSAKWTVPSNFKGAQVMSWEAGLAGIQTSYAVFQLKVRPSGGLWKVVDQVGANTGSGGHHHQLDAPIALQPGDDVKVSCSTMGVDNTAVFANIEMKYLD